MSGSVTPHGHGLMDSSYVLRGPQGERAGEPGCSAGGAGGPDPPPQRAAEEEGGGAPGGPAAAPTAPDRRTEVGFIPYTLSPPPSTSPAPSTYPSHLPPSFHNLTPNPSHTVSTLHIPLFFAQALQNNDKLETVYLSFLTNLFSFHCDSYTFHFWVF